MNMIFEFAHTMVTPSNQYYITIADVNQSTISIYKRDSSVFVKKTELSIPSIFQKSPKFYLISGNILFGTDESQQYAYKYEEDAS